MKAKDKKKLRKITVWFKSSEEGNKSLYKCERHRDGLKTCFCEGDVYGVQRGIRCKHVKRITEIAQKFDSNGNYKLPPLDWSDYKVE